MRSAMRCIETTLRSLSALFSGTRRLSQLSLKWTASPDSSTAPVFGSFTSSDWWPGVWPGVDVIGMRVRHRDVFDVGRLDAELVERRRQRLGAAPVRHARIGGTLPIRHGGDRIGKSRIPQEPALRVLDQVAIVHEVHGLADVHPGRPARDVAGDALAAVQDVELFHARLLGLTETGAGTERYGQASGDDETA